MKRRIAISLIAAAVTVAAAGVQAGDRGHGSWGHYGGHPGTAHAAHQWSRGAHRRHHRYHARRHHWRPHYRHHRHDALKFVAGAALLGTLVTTLDRPAPAGAVIHRRGYAAQRPYSVQQNRWYQRDSYGDCFEVVLQRDGQQVWTRVHPSYCR